MLKHSIIIEHVKSPQFEIQISEISLGSQSGGLAALRGSLGRGRGGEADPSHGWCRVMLA